ncbi:hypothetical protein N234_22960 [Ralstonia pickettii DTP0602]|nr:hypothetical protein N234_22960 [Ralstonia pickettii DTP0602]
MARPSTSCAIEIFGADDIQRLFGIGERQQVVRIESADPRPAQGLGDIEGLGLVDQGLEPAQVGHQARAPSR